MTQWLDYSDPDELAAYLAHLADDRGDDADEAEDDADDASDDEPSAPAVDLPPLPVPDQCWFAESDSDVFVTPWVEPPMLVPTLEIGPGRPIGLVGAPGSGKNDMAQALALAVMSGRPAFELFPVARRGRVVHLTWDMGRMATRLRYRALAAGAAIPYDELRGRLTVSVYPSMHLAADGAAKAFAKLLKGYDLAILDNIRSATPGVDENASAFGGYLEVYGRAAQAAGCTPLYLHHARKSGGGDATAMRGSNAIQAASGCVWLLEGEKSAPRKVSHARQHDMSDGPKPDFWLTHDTPRSGATYDMGTHGPKRLVARFSEPVSAERVAGARERVLEAVRANPGASYRVVEREAAGNKQATRAALDALLTDGAVADRRHSGQQAASYFATGATVPNDVIDEPL